MRYKPSFVLEGHFLLLPYACFQCSGWMRYKPSFVLEGHLSGRRITTTLCSTTSSLPEATGVKTTPTSTSVWPCTGRGLPCYTGHPMHGALLPHLFTLTLQARRYIFCGTNPERHRLQCRRWTLSIVPVFWCSDFPPHRRENPHCRATFSASSRAHYTRKLKKTTTSFFSLRPKSKAHLFAKRRV